MDRHTDQWTRTESPETNPYFHRELIFQQGGQDHSLKEQSLQRMVLGQTDIHMQKKEGGSGTSTSLHTTHKK